MIFAAQMYKSMEQERKLKNKHTIICLNDQEERTVISTN